MSYMKLSKTKNYMLEDTLPYTLPQNIVYIFMTITLPNTLSLGRLHISKNTPMQQL